MTEVQAGPRLDPTRRIVETIRAIVVTGILYGAVVAGVGSRLAMLLLRVTSSDRVIGIQSDDDFTIGRVHPRRDLQPVAARRGVRDPRSRRLSLVAPRLIGPVWFRRVTVGLASGAVAGSMLVHADGIDFTQLTPKWLAIGLFVALPAVFGKFIGPAFDAVSAPDSWAATGRRRWLIPVIAIACFRPPSSRVLTIAVVVALFTSIGEVVHVRKLRATAAATLIIRGVWLLIAVAGLNALINDIVDLT
jgi:hypothetical protein